MTTFLVTTREMVEGTYEVDAEDANEAMEIMLARPLEWSRVTQIDYQCYEVKIDGMKEIDR